ncbi:hypothetical protein HPP92_014951 [Vanilla planifolia]|uniref:TF-B3 domain-containing protein n=1 Tax=Vanilla planifolia TaxID=51239 RepID=A0A835QL01_VANPL|nr:hypothetical protein HPP92_014951 [Vanilla planifolia]
MVTAGYGDIGEAGMDEGQNTETLEGSDQVVDISGIRSYSRRSCFWLGLPAKFCKDHLPPKETTMVLEDENGDEHEAIYIARRTGLSGGWRSFAVDHELEDGDALIFKLIEPSRFKVYIVKAIGSSAETKDSKSSIGDVCASLESSQIDGLTCKSRPSRENESADPAGNSRRRKQSRPRPSN